MERTSEKRNLSGLKASRPLIEVDSVNPKSSTVTLARIRVRSRRGVCQDSLSTLPKLMTLTKTASSKTFRSHLQGTFETLMALLVLLNYLFVIFDATYVPLRDFWLQGHFQVTLLRFNEPIALGPIIFQELQIPPNEPFKIPFVTGLSRYDIVKGIKPYRSTTNYLAEVEELEKISQNADFSPASNNRESQKTIDDLLIKLRRDSISMIDTNPFQGANKTGTLEKIKNKMRLHVFATENVSAKETFERFWSRDYLTKNGFDKELQFFDREIKPLIETNYYRPIGEDGRPIDNFEAIDFFFGLIFFAEFLMRTWWIAYTHVGLRWLEAMLWRWYDIFLFIPVFRWLRIIPTLIRLDQARLINFSPIRQQVIRGVVATISTEITEVIVVRVINKLQDYIRRGGVHNFLTQHTQRELIDINDLNEIAEIAKLMIQITVEQVLPQIQPEAEALIKHNLDKVLEITPAYQSLQQLPGMKALQTQLSDRVSRQLYQAFTEIASRLGQEDKIADRLLEQLVQRVGQTMGTELQSRHSIDRLEMLLTALLEEVKLNYVQDLSQEDIELILEQTRELRRENAKVPRLEPVRYRRFLE
jgi:hypothetical protein